MKTVYVEISSRRNAPLHVVKEMQDTWNIGDYVYVMHCGLERRNPKTVGKAYARRNRICWNCKRVLGWK